MDKLIKFAVNLLEKDNSYSENSEGMPSQNPLINPSQNPDINTSQNPAINSSQNPDINWTQNPHWKRNQWELFKKTILWEYLDENQKLKCKEFLRQV